MLFLLVHNSLLIKDNTLPGPEEERLLQHRCVYLNTEHPLHPFSLPLFCVFQISAAPSLFLCLLQVSYFEIYMDKIRDLLDGVLMNWTHGFHTVKTQLTSVNTAEVSSSKQLGIQALIATHRCRGIGRSHPYVCPFHISALPGSYVPRLAFRPRHTIPSAIVRSVVVIPSDLPTLCHTSPVFACVCVSVSAAPAVYWQWLCDVISDKNFVAFHYCVIVVTVFNTLYRK